MPSALVSLANITLGSSATTITFSSISGAYKDLHLVASIIAVSNGSYIQMGVNNDTSSTYAKVSMTGSGSAASSVATTGTYIFVGDNVSASNVPGYVSTMDFMDYSATDKHKTILIRTGNAASGTEAQTARWPSTSAITSIQLYGTNFAAGTTFALYGVSA